jgi:hypothetical protein
MERGSMFLVTAGAGSLPFKSSIQPGNLIAMMVPGYGRTPVGTGTRIIPGGGRRSTMVAGVGTRTTDGFGGLTGRGGRLGSVGVTLIIFAVGRPCRRALVFMLESVGLTMAAPSLRILGLASPLPHSRSLIITISPIGILLNIGSRIAM